MGMQADEQLLEQVVARVLEQLRTPPDAARNGSSNGQHKPETASKSLILDERVITGELLESRLNGSPRVEFSPQAVLTPSARDVLRKRGVEWSRSSAKTQRHGGKAATWKAIVVNPTPTIDSALGDLDRSGLGCERLTAGCADGAAKLAIKILKENPTAGIIAFTKRPAVAACRANRDALARAAVVSTARELDELRRVMGPNVFCISPEGKAFFELRNLLRAITAASPSKPEKWES